MTLHSQFTINHRADENMRHIWAAQAEADAARYRAGFRAKCDPNPNELEYAEKLREEKRKRIEQVIEAEDKTGKTTLKKHILRLMGDGRYRTLNDIHLRLTKYDGLTVTPESLGTVLADMARRGYLGSDGHGQGIYHIAAKTRKRSGNGVSDEMVDRTAKAFAKVKRPAKTQEICDVAGLHKETVRLAMRVLAKRGKARQMRIPGEGNVTRWEKA